MSAKLIRLDKLITDRKLAPSRTAAQLLIEEGRVKVDGAVAKKPASMVSAAAAIIVDAPEKEWVSRGAYKLLRAFERFPIDARGKRCVDVGASTGGFTDVLLANGAAIVYAVDVGYGQLAWKLRNDPRVRVMERTNARNLTLDMIDGEKADIVVSDASFISLTLLFGAMENLLADDGVMAVLVKPQFEAGRERVGKGVITDPKLHEDILNEVADFIDERTELALARPRSGGLLADTRPRGQHRVPVFPEAQSRLARRRAPGLPQNRRRSARARGAAPEPEEQRK